jgi:hypothetical protein
MPLPWGLALHTWKNKIKKIASSKIQKFKKIQP